MKNTQPPTLSAYLLEKANKFQYYPLRNYGKDSGVVRKVHDQIRHKLAEWRKTFAPQDDHNAIIEFMSSPVSLDELYCRDLLQAVPVMVERTLSLRHLNLVGMSDSHSLVYLREAANCYISGLPLAAVALARAALEDALTQKFEKLPGASVGKRSTLTMLIDSYAARGNALSPEWRGLAHKVRLAGNDVLHQQNAESTNALEVIEAARTVILDLARTDVGNKRSTPA